MPVPSPVSFEGRPIRKGVASRGCVGVHVEYLRQARSSRRHAAQAITLFVCDVVSYDCSSQVLLGCVPPVWFAPHWHPGSKG